MNAQQGLLNRRKQEPAELFEAGIAKAAAALAGEWANNPGRTICVEPNSGARAFAVESHRCAGN